MQDLRFRHLHGRVQVSIQTASFHSPLDFPKNTPPPTNWTLNISRPHTCHSKIRTGYLLRHGHLANMGTTTPPRRLLSGSPGCHRFWADDMTGCFLLSCCHGRLRWQLGIILVSAPLSQLTWPRRRTPLGALCSPRTWILLHRYGVWGSRRASHRDTHTQTHLYTLGARNHSTEPISFVFFLSRLDPNPRRTRPSPKPFPSLPFPSLLTSHHPLPPSTPRMLPSPNPPPHSQELRTYATLTSFAAPNLHMSHRNTTHPPAARGEAWLPTWQI